LAIRYHIDISHEKKFYLDFSIYSLLYQIHIKKGIKKKAHLLIVEHETSLKEMDSAKLERLLAMACLEYAQQLLKEVRIRLYIYMRFNECS
jgi:hypothetical protein